MHSRKININFPFFTFLFFIIIFFNSSNIFCQDQIFLKEYKDTIYCKIIKDNVIEILYLNYPISDSIIHSIKGSEIEGYTLAENSLTSLELKKFGTQSNQLVYENSLESQPPLCIFKSLESFQKNNFEKLDSGFYFKKKIFTLDSLKNPIKIKGKIFGGKRGDNFFLWKKNEPQWFEIHGWFSVFNIRIDPFKYVFIGIPLLPIPIIVPIQVNTPIKDIKYRKMILDTQTGKVFRLNTSTLKNRILSFDPDLLEKFLKEKKHGIVLIKYVKLFNERNKPPYLQIK